MGGLHLEHLWTCSSLYLCHPSLCQVSFSSMADGSYLLTGLFPMPPTCSPCSTKVLLYSIDMVTILPGFCTAACEALSLQHCQPTALPLTLVASAILSFLLGLEGTSPSCINSSGASLTWDILLPGLFRHLEHPS